MAAVHFLLPIRRDGQKLPNAREVEIREGSHAAYVTNERTTESFNAEVERALYVTSLCYCAWQLGSSCSSVWLLGMARSQIYASCDYF